jgi:hypothetical protein
MASNKNLGPVIMNCDGYIELVFTEHFLTPAYLKLSPMEEKTRMDDKKDNSPKHFISMKTCYARQNQPILQEVLKINTILQFSTRPISLP